MIPSTKNQQHKALFNKYKDDKEGLAEVFTSVVFIGVTGTGKSHTAQSLSGVTDLFKTSAGSQS